VGGGGGYSFRGGRPKSTKVGQEKNPSIDKRGSKGNFRRPSKKSLRKKIVLYKLSTKGKNEPQEEEEKKAVSIVCIKKRIP